jgi:signal transduction histidine kinase
MSTSSAGERPPASRLSTVLVRPDLLVNASERSIRVRAWTSLFVPYVLITFLAVFTVIFDHQGLRPVVTTLVLCGAAVVWMLWMVTLHLAWRHRPRVMGVFFAGMIVIMALLVIQDPWFGFFSPALYLFAFALLPWPWRLAGVTAAAVVAATAQTSGADKATAVGLVIYVAAIAINVLPMNGLAWFLHQNEAWHDLRQRSINELSEANRQLEATLAENAGLHKQLLTQAREAGVQDERQRLAREIHDTLAQGLTGIVTQLQAAEQASRDPVRWRRHVHAATALARESLAEARRSVDALRPEPLEIARLGDALVDVARRWSTLHGIEAQVTTTGTPRPLGPEAEFALLRTAQEALANVAKHAQASRVGLTLSYMDHEVALDVRDDGRGFDAIAASGSNPTPSTPAVADLPDGGGFGLVAMRQRIEGMSGTLQVESEPGEGTAISACVPTAPAGATA